MAETNEEEAWTLLEGKIGKRPEKKKKSKKEVVQVMVPTSTGISSIRRDAPQ